MVGNLTVGKKGYEAAWTGLSDLAVRAQGLKARLLAAVDEDTAAFSGIMEAGRLPKASPEEKAAREEALQAAYRQASLVPFHSAELCLEVIHCAAIAAEKGNVNSVSDAGVGALIGFAGLEGAVLNVLINLGSVADKAFAADLASRAEGLVQEGAKAKDAVVAKVRSLIQA